jgi:hypothetical protein
VGFVVTRDGGMGMDSLLSAVKEGQHKYCETVYSRSGINHMWILKNSKDLLDSLKSRSFSQVSSIKTFDFSTLYTRSRFVCGVTRGVVMPNSLIRHSKSYDLHTNMLEALSAGTITYMS